MAGKIAGPWARLPGLTQTAVSVTLIWPDTHPEEVHPILAPNFPNNSSKLLRASGLAVLLCLSIGAIGGCGIFDPDRGDGVIIEPPPEYPILELPSRVLRALEIAYEARDSVGYAALYDSSYIGESIDRDDPPGTEPSSFRFADEVAHVAALRRNNSIGNVVMDLGSETSWTRLPSDDPSHPEWAVIQISQLKIEVTEGTTTYQATTGDGVFIEFKFTPTTPAPSSPTDTLWKIIRWKETKD